MRLFWILLLIFILPLVDAARINLFVNQSYSDDGKNITLLNIDEKRDKALVCINNEAAILSEGKQKTVNDVSLLIKKISKDQIRVDIKVYCDDCVCDNNCLNFKCIQYETETFNEKEIKEEKESLKFIGEEEVINNPGIKSQNILLALSILIIFSIILYYLIKR